SASARPHARCQLVASAEADSNDGTGSAAVWPRRSGSDGSRVFFLCREPDPVLGQAVRTLLPRQNSAADACELPLGSPAGSTDEAVFYGAVRALITPSTNPKLVCRDGDSELKVARAACRTSAAVPDPTSAP